MIFINLPISLIILTPKENTSMMSEKSIRKQQPYVITVLDNLGGIFFDRKLPNLLKKKFRIISKSTGISSSSKNNVEFVDPPYFIDRFAIATLHQQSELCQTLGISLKIKGEKTAKKLTDLLNTEEFIIFRHFSKDYYLIDGHKFGSLFLAYEEDPEKSHAKYLIFTGDYDNNHLTRLAAACKKVGLHAHIENGQINIKTCQRVDQKKRYREQENLQKDENPDKQDVGDYEKLTKKQKIEQQANADLS